MYHRPPTLLVPRLYLFTLIYVDSIVPLLPCIWYIIASNFFVEVDCFFDYSPGFNTAAGCEVFDKVITRRSVSRVSD